MLVTAVNSEKHKEETERFVLIEIILTTGW